MIIDIKHAKKRAACARYNDSTYSMHKEALEDLRLAITPYKRFKRINATHLKEMQSMFPAIRWLRLEKREYFAGYELRYTIERPWWDEHDKEPRTKLDQCRIVLTSEELGGEAIYKALNIELGKYDWKTVSFPEAETDAFYKEFEELLARHACSSKAMDYLGR